MGQLLSRDDDEEYIYHDVALYEVHEEKPLRRQRNAAMRSRRTKQPTNGRTRRSRANPVTFEVHHDY
jgi:hypothetical protein